MALSSKFLRFAIVGTGGAIVHVTTVMLLVNYLQMHPLSANVAGFLLGFQVSYFGHRYWTFSDSNVRHQTAFPRLLALQIFNFGANETMFYILLSLHLPYLIALLIVLCILPVMTFTVSRLWIFTAA